MGLLAPQIQRWHISVAMYSPSADSELTHNFPIQPVAGPAVADIPLVRYKGLPGDLFQAAGSMSVPHGETTPQQGTHSIFCSLGSRLQGLAP